MNNAEAILTIENLYKHFPVNGGTVEVLHDINFRFRAGEFVTIVGGSGCGKSTLLRIISGFIRDFEGSVLLCGKPISGPGRDRGFVFQEARLMPWLTVEENVAFGLLDRKQAPLIVPEYLKLVGLDKFAKAKPYLEKAYKSQPSNTAAKDALKSIYYHLGDAKKLEELEQD